MPVAHRPETLFKKIAALGGDSLRTGQSYQSDSTIRLKISSLWSICAIFLDRHTLRLGWLGRQDSNLGWRDQNPLPYRLATPQCLDGRNRPVEKHGPVRRAAP